MFERRIFCGVSYDKSWNLGMFDFDGVRHSAGLFGREDGRCEEARGTVDLRSTSRNKVEEMARGETTAVDGEALPAVELPRNSRQIRPADSVEFWRHVTSARQNACFICDCGTYLLADEPQRSVRPIGR